MIAQLDASGDSVRAATAAAAHSQGIQLKEQKTWDVIHNYG
jgi:hypothetical protein